MKSFLKLLIVLFGMVCLVSACKYDRGIILFNTQPITRENALAEMKQRADEWRAQQGNAIKATPTTAAASQPAVTDDDYNF